VWNTFWDCEWNSSTIRDATIKKLTVVETAATINKIKEEWLPSMQGASMQ
jgi:hypothetical protein